MRSPLVCGSLGCAASHDIRANHECLLDGIHRAAAAGIQVLLTPEAALIGYPEVVREDLEAVDWRAVAALEDELAEVALERGVVLVLGTASPWRHGIGDDALVCGAVDDEQRYRARCLTGRELRNYLAGQEAVTIDCAGWRLGIGISYDLRFPSLWGDYARRGCDAFLLVCHFAGPGDIRTRQAVLPALCSARAAEWVTPVVACNTGADDRWTPCAAWAGDGMALSGDDCGHGLTRFVLAHRDQLDAFYHDLRANALAMARPLKEQAIG